MDKRELEQIRDLCKELEHLKKQFKALKFPIVTDSVKGSSKFFPYINHTILITGIESKSFNKGIEQIKKDMKDKISEIMDKVAEANRYIATIPDADTRIILQSRFINGLTFEEIERDFNISHTTAHRKYRKWLDSQ